ncbi:MAG: DUF2442 domain-containing protein [Afipia sp.]|nr:DUF2442 domain-containing protein [Afipia sp.]
MARHVQKIKAVSVIGPSRLQIVWQDAATDQVDLSDWIKTGGETLAPLLDRKMFAKAAVANHGAAVTWDEGEGDLSIDAHHLSLIGEQ